VRGGAENGCLAVVTDFGPGEEEHSCIKQAQVGQAGELPAELLGWRRPRYEGQPNADSPDGRRCSRWAAGWSTSNDLNLRWVGLPMTVAGAVEHHGWSTARP